jgi:hypothetical protein
MWTEISLRMEPSVQGDLRLADGPLMNSLSMPTAALLALPFQFVQLLVPRGSVAELILAIITSINSEGALRKKSLLQFIQRTLPLIDISAFPSSSPISKNLDEPVFLGVFLLIYYFKFDLVSEG